MPRRPLRRHGRRTGTSLRRFSRRMDSRPHSRLLAVTLIGLAGVAFLGGVMLLFIVLSFGAVVGLGSVAAGGAFASITGDLPDVEAAVDRPAFKTASIYDRKGRLLHEIIDPHGGRRTIVNLHEMPQHLIDAVTATEDPRYFTNPGFDLRSIARALLQNLQGREIVSGASTITQQLVRATLLPPDERYEQTYRRKLREAVLAYRLSQTFSKEEILERYLNEIYFGNLAYGVEAASRAYFNKSVSELNLSESAFIAGLIQSPVSYNPFTNPKEAKARQFQVLNLMVKHGFLDLEAALKAQQDPIRLESPVQEMKASHFVVYIRDLIERDYGTDLLYYGGIEIHTTIDLDMLEVAQRIAREHLSTLREFDANNAALVAIDPKTAEVLVMMGSLNYWDPEIDGQVNMSLAERQPGSTLKPFTYLTAFEQKIASPATIIEDEETEFDGGAGRPPYVPRNHDREFQGPVSIRKALGNSRNVPAVKMLNDIGIYALLDTMHRFGITSLNEPNRYGLSLTLGGGEVRLLDLVYAYSVLANGGEQVGAPVREADLQPGRRVLEPIVITKIIDSSGNVVFEQEPARRERLASEQTTWLITDILSDDEARQDTYGPNSFLKLSRPAAAKTGTTEHFEDSWTIGYTPNLAVGVWVGNADYTPMDRIFGSRGAGGIWHNFMEEALADLPTEWYDRPVGIVRASVDAETGLRPAPDKPVIADWFVEGTLPRRWAAPAATPTPLIQPEPIATFEPPPEPTAEPTPNTGQDTSVKNASHTGIVPNLVGLEEEEARRIITDSGLNNTYPNYQTESDVADKNFFNSINPGHVLSHMPGPGSEVGPGSTIWLAVRKR